MTNPDISDIYRQIEDWHGVVDPKYIVGSLREQGVFVSRRGQSIRFRLTSMSPKPILRNSPRRSSRSIVIANRSE